MRTNLTTEQSMELREWLTTGQAEEIRRAAGLSRPGLAREIGVAESALWRWEHGDRMPTGLYAAAYYRLLARLAARCEARAAAGGGAGAV
jgi:DNA-binding transcriptional regulator YiaG